MPLSANRRDWNTREKEVVVMMDELVQLETLAVRGGHLVKARGELDVSNAPLLADTLVQFANGAVTIDLTSVTFLDSSGCSALLAAHDALQRRGSRLYVRGARGTVLRVLELMALDRVLDLDGDRPTA
jgi:anti-sigma B factor antagonist